MNQVALELEIIEFEKLFCMGKYHPFQGIYIARTLGSPHRSLTRSGHSSPYCRVLVINGWSQLPIQGIAIC